MRRTLVQQYHALKEAGSTSDFPDIVSDVAHKKLLAGFRGVTSEWRKWCASGNLSDFKPHNRVIVGEAPDLLDVPENGEFDGGDLPADDKYQITLKTVGRTYKLTRQAIINDDLNAFNQWAFKYGRAYGRTIARSVIGKIEANAVCYDGTALFGHSNVVAGNLTNDAAGVAKLTSAVQLMMAATDPRSGEKAGVRPYALVASESMLFTCQALLSKELRPVSTSGGPTKNVIADMIPGGVIWEPFLSLGNRVYLVADPNEFPVAEVGFLDGKEEPDMLLRNPECMRYAGGGSDPWGLDIDDMMFKIRGDFQSALAYPQGIVGIGGGLA